MSYGRTSHADSRGEDDIAGARSLPPGIQGGGLVSALVVAERCGSLAGVESQQDDDYY